MAQQGSSPRRPARLPVGSRRGRAGKPVRSDRSSGSRPDDFYSDTDHDLPPWAGLSIYAARPGGTEARPPAADLAGPGEPGGDGGDRSKGRAAAARARKSKRRLYLGGGAAVIVIVVVLAVAGKLPFQGAAAPSSQDGLVTTFQPGDIRAVPDACHAVPAPTLGQYLPGTTARVITQSLAGGAESQCTWTLDAKPLYRVLEVTSQAYPPSLLATGDGSATFSAIDAYNTALQGLQEPAKATRRPKAQLATVRGLGNASFSALQVYRSHRSKTDFITVAVRDRNVLITVTLQGLDSGAEGYGPVPVGTLQAGAVAVAREVLAGIS